MSVYTELCDAVESTGLKTSAIALPTSAGSYAVIRMTSQITEKTADDKPTIYGNYLQVDIFTDSDVNAKAEAVRDAAMEAGFVYRGRSDSAAGARQHAEIRLMKLETAT